MDDPTRVRRDLKEVLELQALPSDEARLKHDPKFVKRLAARHAQGYRSARENVADLVDAGTFVEYGRLRVAGQRKRRSLGVLQRTTPADGVITGTGKVNGGLYGAESDLTWCGVLAYD